MAQRAEVMTRTLLLQSELALLQWQPASALLAATEAAAHMSRVADDVNIPTFENDETERYSLSPTLWIQCRVQVGCLCEFHTLDLLLVCVHGSGLLAGMFTSLSFVPGFDADRDPTTCWTGEFVSYSCRASNPALGGQLSVMIRFVWCI